MPGQGGAGAGGDENGAEVACHARRPGANRSSWTKSPRLGHFDFTPHHPLFSCPACSTSGSFPRKSSSRTKAADAIGTAHQRTANNPDALAERVARDLKLLWPHLTGPERS